MRDPHVRLFDPETLLWVDRASFQTELTRRLTARRITSGEAQLLSQWHDAGYVILRNAVESELIDALWLDYERAWAERPMSRILSEGAGVVPLSQLPPRRQLHHHRYRLMDFHNLSEAAARIMLHPVIVNFFRLIFEDTPIGMQSLTFEYSSEQRGHQDFAYVTARIPSHLGAAWVACEAVTPERGPLFLYPGSHRMIRKFDFGDGRIVFDGKDPSQIERFETHLERECERHHLPRECFTAEKGDVLLWHGALVHGGSPAVDRTATRKSYVTHYSSAAAYPRDLRALDQPPDAVQVNGGMYYKWIESGHVENRYQLSHR